MTTDLPRLVITGASSLLGRRLLDALKEECRLFGLARRSQATAGAPVHPNIAWFQLDIGDRPRLAEAFREIRLAGGAAIVVHLAAHYDFTGEEHPEYWRTNVEGLRNVLEECKGLGLRRFIFSSSLAACEMPPPDGALTEFSPPDGTHIYARTKGIGERMLLEYEKDFPSCIIRFAAMYSDWCEYPPLYMFLSTWLSDLWNRRILAGRGQSAIPYLHVEDGAQFMLRVLRFVDDFDPSEVLIASPHEATSHLELFEAATRAYFGHPLEPIFVPKLFCDLGIRVRCAAGGLLGYPPCERPWMVRYIDRQMNVTPLRTRQRLGWEPRARLGILRRMPFLIENMKTDPLEWSRRNRAAMKAVQFRTNLKVYSLLEKHEDEISEIFTERLHDPQYAHRFASYRGLTEDQHRWHHKAVLRSLASVVRTREKGIFLGYCRDLAEQRFAQGFKMREVCDALEILNEVCLLVLRQDPEAEDLDEALKEYVSVTLWLGQDQIAETYDALEEKERRGRGGAARDPTTSDRS